MACVLLPYSVRSFSSRNLGMGPLSPAHPGEQCVSVRKHSTPRCGGPCTLSGRLPPPCALIPGVRLRGVVRLRDAPQRLSMFLLFSGEDVSQGVSVYAKLGTVIQIIPGFHRAKSVVTRVDARR